MTETENPEPLNTPERPCDFCISSTIEWIIPAAPFEVAPANMSPGDWVACGSCGELIHAGKWGSLAPRATKLWPRGESDFAEAAQAVRRLGAALSEHMTGEPRRVER
ncbi:hypothetical protein ACFVWG_23870 [Kribbella sp. NPDC058245]|uniref:hypothetical protein n=1 Tax=Kribbella sp. NPDC058245 TaxID=3346399 RepID=UPI0036E24C51